MNAPQKLAKPVDFDQLYPNRFLKAGEFLGKKFTLTIADVEIEEIETDKGKQIKGIISFKETTKQLLLNKTNGLCLKAMFGRGVTDWIGKRVTIFPGEFKGEPAIRVWGSPDIAHDTDVLVKMPQKKPMTMTMHKVAAGGGSKAAPTQAPPADEPREPGDDDR